MSYDNFDVNSEDKMDLRDLTERNSTEKFREYKLSICKQNFTRSISLWRKIANRIEILISDHVCTVRDLKTERDILMSQMNEVSATYSEFTVFLMPEEMSDPANTQFDNIEVENHLLVKAISARIEEIESEDIDGKSSRSSRSRTTRTSSRSNLSSVAAKAASLKVKLRYMDLEAKSKALLIQSKAELDKSMADLDKIKCLRDIEMAEASLGAMKLEEDFELNLPTQGTGEYVTEYVKAHAMDNPAISVATDVPAISLPSSNPAFSLPVSYPVVSLPSNNPAISVATDVPAISLPTNNPTVNLPLTTPLSSFPYNTSVSEFVPKMSPTLQNIAPISSTHEHITGVTPVEPMISKQHDKDQSFLELTKTLVDQLNLSRLPPPEPTMFNGDPLKFPSWKASFHTLIDQRKIPNNERIHYLKKYLGSSVREVIENYFLLSSDSAYDEAKTLLDERYGNPFVIADAFRTKLEKWYKINPRDGKELQKFADFLKQCHTAMETIGTLNILNDERENKKMLTKLPDWIVARWGRIVWKWKEENKMFPPFKEFVGFIVKEAKIACDPVTSLQSFNTRSIDTKNKVQHGRSLMTDAKESKAKHTEKHMVKKDSCSLCKKDHVLDDCRIFLSKPLKDRKDYVQQNGLCFACLCIGHLSRRCRQRLCCKTCGKSHPTSLHGDIKEDATEPKKLTEVKTSESHAGVSFMSSSVSCSSMIVPVFVSHVDSPDNEKLVYAMLDTQSDTTFVLDDTYKSLGLSGSVVHLLLSTMHDSNRMVSSHRVKGLVVRGFNSSLRIPLSANRNHISTPEMARKWPYLDAMANELMPMSNCEIGLLIGYNCTRALVPRDVIPPVDNGPFGIKTDLGWSVVGVTDMDIHEKDTIGSSHSTITYQVPFAKNDGNTGKLAVPEQVVFSFRTCVREIVDPFDITRMLELDFNSQMDSTGTGLSRNDKRFIELLTANIHITDDGHYEMPLPFIDKCPMLTNNKAIALKRLTQLEKRFQSNPEYKERYHEFINNLITNGYAERVVDLETEEGQTWYIPHHGVYHPKKTDKLRVVFDCSVKYNGESLNDHLLQGPDLTNNIVGVLCRFRSEPVAFMCDVEQMFHQFRVNVEHRNYLRFLWWDDKACKNEPVAYRMCVHLFGAASSPGCANFALKQIADDNENEFGKDVANFIRRDFYVDDGLKSVPTAELAIDMIQRSKGMCSKGGLRLHKIISNSKEVLSKIPSDDRSKSLEGIDLLVDDLPLERALGVQWCVESDTFQYRIVLCDKPLTRRGILSTINSVYDPLGFIAPVVLVGKQILQKMCGDGADWDTPLPETLRLRWEKWRGNLHHLESVKIRRCLKPDSFAEVSVIELHHFSDASTNGYGQCSYIRLVDTLGNVHCSLVIGKARVVPLKAMTIPRLELTAATVSVRVSAMLQRELELGSIVEWFWTDSSVVLGYISNDSRRFHVFVGNRVQQIRDHCEPSQWRYVKTADNPADIASRGASADELVKSDWFQGPSFLWENELPSLSAPNEETSLVQVDDPEVRKVSTLATKGTLSFDVLERLNRFSGWNSAKRAIAGVLRFKRKLQDRSVKFKKVKSSQDKIHDLISTYQRCTVADLREAELEIIRIVQANAFVKEIETLRKNAHNSSGKKITLKGSHFHKLDTFIDKDNVVRVGGRIRRSLPSFETQIVHPVVLPRNGHLTELLIRHAHDVVQHQGRGMTTNELRSSGYWILGCSSAVSKYLSECVTCRRLRGQLQTQKMADLPTDRLEPAPPFTYSGVDYFGPWLIKEGRRELKRYGVVFTCLLCRAVHLEVANSLDTSSFINALRRFISLRGPVRQLRSDRGTNFVGAERELREAMSELNEARISQFLSTQGCDIVFKMNVPSASHMGGVWERQIRTIRSVLSSLLHQSGSQLDDEALRTFMCEVAAIVNSRPLTVENLNDPLSLPPLTPNQLLTMKSNIILPPPGEFMKADLYSRKRWRRIQYLANEFWTRWRKEYLQAMQIRNKWTSDKRNMQVDDIVLIKDENAPRNCWHLGKIDQAILDEDNLVRKVRVVVGTRSLDSKGKRLESLSYLERPIHKLVLLCESE